MAKLDAQHERMIAKMDAWIEEMEACVGKLEANPQKLNATAKARKEEATMQTFGALKKCYGDWHLGVGCCLQLGPRIMVGSRRSWPPPAEG
jgi:hypothetical protein